MALFAHRLMEHVYAGMTDTTTMQSYYASRNDSCDYCNCNYYDENQTGSYFIYLSVNFLHHCLCSIFCKTPEMCNIGAGLMGFFAAGGVLQMATATVK